MNIIGISLDDLIAIVAGLVERGLTFEAHPDLHNDGKFSIRLTGGY